MSVNRNIVWRDRLDSDLSLADALERDSRQIGAGLLARVQAWLAKREAERLRKAHEFRPVSPYLSRAPSLNPDGTDAAGRIVDYCRFMAFYARKPKHRPRPRLVGTDDLAVPSFPERRAS